MIYTCTYIRDSFPFPLNITTLSITQTRSHTSFYLFQLNIYDLFFQSVWRDVYKKYVYIYL